jgi:hypothetical protein
VAQSAAIGWPPVRLAVLPFVVLAVLATVVPAAAQAKQVKIGASLFVKTNTTSSECANCGPNGTPIVLTGCSLTVFTQVPHISGATGYTVNLKDSLLGDRSVSGPPFNDSDVPPYKAPSGAHWFGLSSVAGPGDCEGAGGSELARYGIKSAFATVDDKPRIVGTLSEADGSAAAGESVSIAGPTRTTVKTNAGGGFAAVVKKGSYKVTAPKDFCADGGKSCTNSKSVKVSGPVSVSFKRKDENPKAEFKWQGYGKSCLGIDTCESGANAVDIAFDGSASSGSKLVKYEWDFGDGTTGLGPKIKHTFAERRSYVVKLRIEDDKGRQASTSANVDTCSGKTAPQARAAAGLAAPMPGLRQAGGQAFDCFFLFAGAYDVGQRLPFEQTGRYEASSPPSQPSDRVELVKIGKQLRAAGRSWQGKDFPKDALPTVTLRDAGCEVAKPCADEQAFKVNRGRGVGGNADWAARLKLEDWPRHYGIDERAKACRAYVLAQDTGEAGLDVRRRIVFRGRSLGYVAYASSGVKEWKTGDVFCEGQNPVRDTAVGSDQTIITRMFDPVERTDEEIASGIVAPPGAARLYVASPASGVDMSRAAVMVQTGSSLCVGRWSGKAPAARAVILGNTGAPKLGVQEITGQCPAAQGSDDPAIHGYGVNAVSTFDFDQVESCFELLGAIASPQGINTTGLNNVWAGFKARQAFTCNERVAVTIFDPASNVARLAKGRVLFSNGDLDLRIPVQGSWRIIADGALTLDQGVNLGSGGGFDVPAIVASGSITLGQGPVPRGLTKEEKAELLAVAEALDEQGNKETLLGFAMLVPDFLLPGSGVARNVLTWLGRGLAAKGGVGLLTKKALQTAAKDPPDANYAQVARPAAGTLPAVKPGNGLSTSAAKLVTTLQTERVRAAALGEAFTTAVNRGGAAAENNAPKQERTQILAAAKYGKQLAAALETEVALRARVAAALRPSLLKVTFSKDDLTRALASIRQNGVPPEFVTVAKAAGLDENYLAVYLREVLSTPVPNSVGLYAVLTDKKLAASELRAARLLRVVAGRFAKNPSGAVFEKPKSKK